MDLDMEINKRTKLGTLIPKDGVAIELGVAAGDFSDALLLVSDCEVLYSIDRWSDHHNEKEYAHCCTRLAHYGTRSSIIRKTFKDALELFPDESIDFIYIDGYAHTGQNAGETLKDWFPKLKVGGIFAGHDYHTRWQPTIDAVNAFVKRHELSFRFEGLTKDDQYPSWYGVKVLR